LRVVIDTNVFISSFLTKVGYPRKIIDLWKKGDIKLCLSKSIIDEYIEILIRLNIKKGSELNELLQLFANSYNIIFTSQTKKLNIIIDDPDDNKFFECAVKLNAEYIISGDKHLLKVKDYCGIKVLSPKESILDYNIRAD